MNIHPHVSMGSGLQSVCHEAHRGKEPSMLPFIKASSWGSSISARLLLKISSLLPCRVGHIDSPPGSQTYTPCLTDTKATGSLWGQRTHPCSGWGNKDMGATMCTP